MFYQRFNKRSKHDRTLFDLLEEILRNGPRVGEVVKVSRELGTMNIQSISGNVVHEISIHRV